MKNYFMRCLFLVVLQVCLLSGSLFGQVKDSIWDRYMIEYDTLLGSQKYDRALEIISEGKNYIENKYPGDPRVGLAFLYTGFIYFSRKEWESAYEPYKNALNIFLKYYKSENYNSAITHAAIGSVCINLNKLNEAETECLNAEKVFDKLHSVKDRRVISNYVNLSNIYEENRNFESAIEYMRKAVLYSLENFGDSFSQLPKYYNRLGFLQDCAGVYTESEESLLKALNYGKNNKDSTSILITDYYFGLLYFDMKKYSLSKEYLKQSENIIKSVNEDISTKKINQLNIYNKLGSVYRKINRNDSALYFLNLGERLINNMEKKDLFTEGLLFDELGLVYLSQNITDKAYSYFQKSVSAFSSNTEKSKRQKAEAFIHIAHLYEKKKNKDSTDYYYSLAEKIMGISNYREYREFVLLTNNADSLYLNGNYNKAVADYKKALEHGLKVLKGNNDEIATTYYRLGLNLGKEKKYHEAVDYMWKAHNMYEGLTDSRNPGCMKALNYLYDYYYELGEKEKANEIERRMKVIMEIEK